MKYDYLIIGQGLAGSILAYQLLDRGKTVAIIDEQKASTSSRVAAGLVNPFTGPRMVKTWKAEVLFAYMETFYREVERVTSSNFLSEKVIYRPFKSIAESNDWDGRSAQPNYQKHIRKICNGGEHSKYVRGPHGGVEINGFVLDLPVFLDAMLSILSSNCNYVKGRFEEAQLEINNHGIKYHDLEAQKCIFCSGYQIYKSEFFGWIPLAPVKGEVLHLTMNANFKTIYNQSCFIIPKGKGLFKAGSTYNREDLTELPSEQGEHEIKDKLNSLMKIDFNVVKHEAGIRPGTVPRRPLIGKHPVHDQLIVFNGLGSKGVSMAPYFGNELVKCLEDGNNLDQEVDIKKYYSLYFKSQFPIQN